MTKHHKPTFSRIFSAFSTIFIRKVNRNQNGPISSISKTLKTV